MPTIEELKHVRKEHMCRNLEAFLEKRKNDELKGITKIYVKNMLMSEAYYNGMDEKSAKKYANSCLDERLKTERKETEILYNIFKNDISKSVTVGHDARGIFVEIPNDGFYGEYVTALKRGGSNNFWKGTSGKTYKVY